MSNNATYNHRGSGMPIKILTNSMQSHASKVVDILYPVFCLHACVVLRACVCVCVIFTAMLFLLSLPLESFQLLV